MKRKIIVENTKYSLLLYFLLKKNWEKDIFILNDTFDDEFLTLFKRKVKNIFIFKQNSIKKNIFKYYLEILKIYIFLINIYFQGEVEIYGNDNLVYSRFKSKGYILLEDGNINYQIHKTSKKMSDYFKEMIKLKNPFYKPYGYSKKIKKIYLTGLAAIPKEIENKVEIINLKKLWELKTKKEQQEILEVFGFNREILEKVKEKNIILFTQPLSEDGIFSEQEKINLYSKIISKYPSEKLVLKSHPREKTSYTKKFKEILVLEQSFPAEIFELLGINFDRAITLFSTAVFGVKSKHIDFYGTEVDYKILEKFGNHDFIMERNVFLD